MHAVGCDGGKIGERAGLLHSAGFTDFAPALNGVGVALLRVKLLWRAGRLSCKVEKRS
jgi:hypothetical protein